MSLTLVTGATGLVGFNIVQALHGQGRRIRALVRSPQRACTLLPPDVELAAGDLTDPDSLRRALAGCSVVYHAAGLPEQWLPDPATFEHVNTCGSRNLARMALEAGVEKFLYTSTIDVFAADRGASYNESTLDPTPKGTAYERSKQRADRILADALEQGLPAIFLHPAAVYGPGPSASPGLNRFFTDLRDGKVPMLLPGGLPVVLSSDVAAGHLLAEERGTVGNRYILSEGYYSLRELAQLAASQLGLERIPPVLPLGVGRLVSFAGERLARLTGRPPLIPRGQLHFLQWGARPVNDKARRDLGWEPTPIAAGLEQTLAYLRSASG